MSKKNREKRAFARQLAAGAPITHAAMPSVGVQMVRSPVSKNSITKFSASDKVLYKDSLIPTIKPFSVPTRYKRAPDDQEMSIYGKPFVMGYAGDYTGCGHLRIILPFAIANAKYARASKLQFMTPAYPVFQEDVLTFTRAVWIQRPSSAETNGMTLQYKELQEKYNYAMIGELDDCMWEVPEYNSSLKYSKIEMNRTIRDSFMMMDKVSVSTNYLKESMASTIGIPLDNIVVNDNTIPKSLYGFSESRSISADLEKPMVLYNGSPTHYNNATRMAGDLGGNIAEFILKYHDEFRIVFMGGHPWYVDDLVKAGKITQTPWFDTFEYGYALRRMRPDFILMPLLDNEFNRCKSNIKYLEACAVGAIGIGSNFKNSPYENNDITINWSMSAEQIRDLIHNLSARDIFNRTLRSQEAYITPRWMDTPENLMRYIELSNIRNDAWTIDRSHYMWDKLKSHLEADE